MTRHFTGDTLVLATHNQGKVKEIAAMLEGHVRYFPTAGELSLPEPEETEASFIGNAVLKARAAAAASGLPALADDSGLAVNALGGEPGIHSARWAGPGKDFVHAMRRVLDEMGNGPDCTAAFLCVLALAWPDGHVETFEGRLEGTIAPAPRGDGGFGYDPIFMPQGHDCTLGELPAEAKAGISHRARAFAKLVEGVFAA